MDGSGGAAAAFRGSADRGSANRGGTRLRWLAVIIAVMAVLTAGWPLLNRVVSDHHRLAANSKLSLGPSRRSAAVVTVGPGWVLRSGESNPRLVYQLERGAVHLSITYATLINDRQLDHLWSGLRAVVEVNHPGATLSTPVEIRTQHGTEGDFGLVRAPDLVGTASVFAGPSRRFAIEMVVEAPKRSALLNLLAAQRIMRSLVFPAAAVARMSR
jgi:hypothetical protein